MTYATLNSVNMSADMTNILVYANNITNGMTTPFICLAFFLVVFMGSLTFQQRTTGVMRVGSSLIAGGFVTLGFELIMMQKNLINGWTFGITMALTLAGFLWVALADAENPSI